MITTTRKREFRKFPIDIDGYRLEKVKSARQAHDCSKQPGCLIFKGDTYYKISETKHQFGRFFVLNTKKLCPAHFKEVVGDSVVEVPGAE